MHTQRRLKREVASDGPAGIEGEGVTVALINSNGDAVTVAVADMVGDGDTGVLAVAVGIADVVRDALFGCRSV